MKVVDHEKIELYPGMMLKNPSTDETYLLLEIQSGQGSQFGLSTLLLELSTGKHYHRRRNFIMFWEVL